MPQDNKLGFLHKKSNLPKASLSNVINDPDFSAAITEAIVSGREIDDNVIYQITKDVYFPKLYSGERSASVLRLRKAVKQFSSTLYGNSEHWMVDYQNFRSSRM